MYESLPLGEVDSRVGHIARHDTKDKPKNTDGTDQEQEDTEVPLLLHARIPMRIMSLPHCQSSSSARCLSEAQIMRDGQLCA